MRIVPITQDEAFCFIDRVHRHHDPPPGGFICIAAAVGDEIVGVAVIGRPCARMNQDGYSAEVSRVATDGTRNACSFLYARAWRIVQQLGYRRLFTYTLPEESGASLRGAGWRCLGEAGGGSWDRKSRPRVDKHPTQIKMKWEAA